MTRSDDDIERLEEKIAWLERHVLEQDKVMLAQEDTLQKLQAALMALQDRMNTRDPPLDPNERPPHY